jgi:hypothetical protein
MMSEATRPAVLTGGCQCGAVRYALYAEPDVGICHCRMCQKATGGLFLASAGVPLAQFAWTEGEPAVFRSSSVAERGYCRDCGTPLFFRYLAKDTIDVTIGSLDDPAAAKPTSQVGVESRVPWWRELFELPGRTTQQDPPPGGLEAMSSFQHRYGDD